MHDKYSEKHKIIPNKLWNSELAELRANHKMITIKWVKYKNILKKFLREILVNSDKNADMEVFDTGWPSAMLIKIFVIFIFIKIQNVCEF